MTRLLALCILLGACSTAQPPGPAAVHRPEPPELRRCLPPVPPPPVPPAPRTVERLAAYAWAEATARWRTADRLDECRRRMDAAIEWMERNP